MFHDVQRSIKWRKKIVQAVLRGLHIGETLFFKMMVVLVTKKKILMFLHTFEFLQY